MKKEFLLLGALVTLAVSTVSVNAETLVNKANIPLNGEWQEAYLGDDEYCRHAIVVPEAGELAVTFQTFCGMNYVKMLDENLVQIYKTNLFASVSDPKTVDLVYDVLPGVYYVQYENYNASGDYRIKASFTAANTQDVEPNNNWSQVQDLPSNKEVSGFLTRKLGEGATCQNIDLYDYYKFTVAKEQEVEILFTPEKAGGIFNLYDVDRISLNRAWRYNTNPYSFKKVLPAGIYFICIESANEAGKYTLKVKQEEEKTPVTEVPETEAPKEELSKGDTFAKGIGEYKVTNARTNTVSLIGITKETINKLTVPATVKMEGEKYKVTEIAAGAIKDVDTLTTLVLGKNVTKVGKNAFRGSSNLNRITFKNPLMKSFGKNAFRGISKTAVINVNNSKINKFTSLLKKTGLNKNTTIK